MVKSGQAKVTGDVRYSFCSCREFKGLPWKFF